MVESELMQHAWMKERMRKEYTLLSPRQTPKLGPSEESARWATSRRGAGHRQGSHHHSKTRPRGACVPSTPRRASTPRQVPTAGRMTELGLGGTEELAAAAGSTRDRFDHRGCLIVYPGERRRGGVIAPDSPAPELEVEPSKRLVQRTEHFDHTGALILTPARRTGLARISANANAEDHPSARARPSSCAGRFDRYIFDHNGQMIHNVNTHRQALVMY
mmetsp:Transcript_11733/g.32059  ORF Transcript_11733/g.32059 Transcript_11733/m.32059 type:complete len:218 (-) Transcript_11733:60-713(-)